MAANEWLLDMVFDHPYSGVEINYRDGQLVITIPFANEDSAYQAFEERQTYIHERFQVIPGEVLRGEIER